MGWDGNNGLWTLGPVDHGICLRAVQSVTDRTALQDTSTSLPSLRFLQIPLGISDNLPRQCHHDNIWPLP
jgi:hypothetical protein